MVKCIPSSWSIRTRVWQNRCLHVCFCRAVKFFGARHSRVTASEIVTGLIAIMNWKKTISSFRLSHVTPMNFDNITRTHKAIIQVNACFRSDNCFWKGHFFHFVSVLSECEVSYSNPLNHLTSNYYRLCFNSHLFISLIALAPLMAHQLWPALLLFLQ